MVKVGILTFVEADNYGAMCQAYALQKTIISLGHNCELIRYRNNSLREQYHFRKPHNNQSFAVFLKRNLAVLINNIRISKFEKFRKKLIISKVLFKDDMSRYCDKFDKIIVGSDQVWNPKNTANDVFFLLSFIKENRRKIAYAASFGNTAYFDQFGNRAKTLLADIPYISVRELEGAEFLEKEFDLKSTYVADPVLLIGKDEWAFKENKQYADDYIFVYQLQPNQDLIQFTNHISDITGYKIIALPYLIPCLMQSKKYYNGHVEYNLAPDEFVNRIKNSKCVITDSFHGVALSIANHKDFWVFIDKAKMNTNGRIISLLKTCGLEHRIVTKQWSGIGDPINYSRVDENLRKLRQDSFDFLKMSLVD